MKITLACFSKQTRELRMILTVSCPIPTNLIANATEYRKPTARQAVPVAFSLSAMGKIGKSR